MDEKQKKEYIIKHIPLSSGKKITEMLNRYWKNSAKNQKNGDNIHKTPATFEEAKEIFS